MTIINKIIRKGNTGYRRVYVSLEKLKKWRKNERRKVFNKYDKR